MKKRRKNEKRRKNRQNFIRKYKNKK